MPRPLRRFEPGQLYFVTNRTQQARYLLRPGIEENEVVASCLAAATERYPGVRLHAFFARW